MTTAKKLKPICKKCKDTGYIERHYPDKDGVTIYMNACVDCAKAKRITIV
jgi:hypothetical protein